MRNDQPTKPTMLPARQPIVRQLSVCLDSMYADSGGGGDGVVAAADSELIDSGQ